MEILQPHLLAICKILMKYFRVWSQDLKHNKGNKTWFLHNFQKKKKNTLTFPGFQENISYLFSNIFNVVILDLELILKDDRI